MAASPRRDPLLRMSFALSWGGVHTDARSFGTDRPRVIAGPDDALDLPLYGLPFPDEGAPIAAWRGDVAHLFVPEGLRLERALKGEPFREVPPGQLSEEEGRRYLPLERGMQARLSQGELVLTCGVDVLRDRAGWDKATAVMWLAVLLIAALGLPMAFLFSGPDPGLIKRAREWARETNHLPEQPMPLDKDGVSPAHSNEGRVVIPAAVH